MDRRNFLKTTGTVIAGATIARSALANAAADANAPAGRLVLPMNRNWRFSRNVAEGAHARDFDDSAYERVVIPHTNARLPWHSFDEKSYEFVSSYRRRFKLPAEARGKRVFVDFEGAMTASTVWINGQRLGEYKGGYTPFSFDLTPHLDFDGENVLAVDLDSSERPDIPPFGYQIDYLTFGGIYREVSLRIGPATFIENVFAKPKEVLTDHPSLDVDCYIQRMEASRDALTLEVSLRDGDRVLAKGTQKIPAAQAATEPAAYPVHLEKLGAI
jgi:beta-galactosidase